MKTSHWRTWWFTRFDSEYHRDVIYLVIIKNFVKSASIFQIICNSKSSWKSSIFQIFPMSLERECSLRVADSHHWSSSSRAQSRAWRLNRWDNFSLSFFSNRFLRFSALASRVFQCLLCSKSLWIHGFCFSIFSSYKHPQCLVLSVITVIIIKPNLKKTL